MASTYFKRTGTTTVNTYTFSAWIKLGTLSSANNTYQVLFSSGNQNILGIYGGSTTSGHNALYHYNNTNLWWTNNLLRDTSAWYHVVAKVSSGTVTTYINGVQTSYATSTYSLGALETTADKTCVGCYAPSATSFFRGSMANVEFVSGTALGPEYFGSTDTATGIWKPGGSSAISDYGADGFKLKMDTTSPQNDTSGKGNNFTLGGGTPTLLQGSPSNVYANFNPLYKSQETLAYGNTASSLPSSGEKFGGACTIAVSTGKWYAEFKMNSGSSSDSTAVGIYGDITSAATANQGVGKQACSICYKSNGEKGIENVFSSYGATYTAGNIIGVALDMTSSTKNITFYKDGATQGNITFTIEQNNEYSGFMHMAANSNSSSHGSDWWANFGEGFFGTTAAGTNADGNGQGLFAYAVPSGYYALNTKNLEAYG